MLVIVLLMLLMGMLTLVMHRVQSRLEPWDDSRHFRG
jgi:hypothetical protein